jgi:hypothetical protein
MSARDRIQAGLGVGTVVACVGYTIWSTVVKGGVAGYLIRMQAWGDDGRYGVNSTWVMTLLIVFGGVGVILASVAFVRALLAGTRPPTALRSVAWARRLTILVPSLVAFGLSAALSLFLIIEGRDAAESLGWFTKLAIFAFPVTLLAWVPLLEALAPAGWHQGPVTGRKVMDVGQGEPTRTLELDGRHYAVSAEDYERAPEGTVVGVLHTGGLFRHVIAVHTDLSRIGGPPTQF